MPDLIERPGGDPGDLRSALRAAFGDRRVWFYGIRHSPKGDPPRGGQQIAMQHANILRGAGVEAWVVNAQGPLSRRNPLNAPEKGSVMAPEGWFRRTVRSDRDVVLIPGFRFREIADIPGDRKVLFSQNVFVTARAVGLRGTWAHPDVMAIMCLSDGNAEIIRLANPDCPVVTVRVSVDPGRFRPAQKERLVLSNGLDIGCEKNPFDIAAIIQILRARGQETDGGPFDFRALEGLRHEEVAELMGKARVLVFPSTHEGLGLLALEGMLAGSLVFAFRRAPMTEYLPRRCQFEFGDLGGMADAVVDALDHPERWQAEIDEGRATALGYSPARQEISVLEGWLRVSEELG